MSKLLIAGIVRKNHHLLHDAQAWVPALVESIGMHAVGPLIVQPYDHWEGGAPSAVQFIEEPGVSAYQPLTESSIVIHTYPEDKFLQVDIDSCVLIQDPEGVAAEVKDLFDLQCRFYQHIIEWDWKGLVARAHLTEDCPDFLR